MNNCINNETLKQGVQILYDQNKITSGAQIDLNSYIDNNTGMYFKKLTYADFDPINSTGVAFIPSSRTITNSSAATLRTNLITSINEFTLEGLKSIVSIPAVITYQISYDQNIWYNISEDNIKESLNTTTGFYLKLTYSTPTSLVGLYVMYS